MKKTNNKTNFENFLKKNDCFEDFCSGLMARHRCDFDDFVTDTIDPYDLIDRSIVWRDSPKGGAFWSKMHSWWNKSVMNNKRIVNREYNSIW